MEEKHKDKKVERREFLKESGKLIMKTGAFCATALFTSGCGFGYRISDHEANLMDKESLENSIKGGGSKGSSKPDVPCGESLRNLCDKYCKYSKTN